MPCSATLRPQWRAGFSLSGLPGDLALSLDSYYSFESTGTFAEVSASRDIPITDQLTLGFSSVLGVNQGYVADGHDGANHVALRLGLEYAITDNFAITAHTVYSWGIDRDQALPGDDQLIDFFHGGVGVQWSF